MVNYPKLGQQVENACVECGRQARPGEVYGPRPQDWDFTDLCPACWDDLALDANADDDGWIAGLADLDDLEV